MPSPSIKLICAGMLSLHFHQTLLKQQLPHYSVTGHILDLMQTNKKYRHQPKIV